MSLSAQHRLCRGAVGECCRGIDSPVGKTDHRRDLDRASALGQGAEALQRIWYRLGSWPNCLFHELFYLYVEPSEIEIG